MLKKLHVKFYEVLRILNYLEIENQYLYPRNQTYTE